MIYTGQEWCPWSNWVAHDLHMEKVSSPMPCIQQQYLKDQTEYIQHQLATCNQQVETNK